MNSKDYTALTKQGILEKIIEVLAPLKAQKITKDLLTRISWLAESYLSKQAVKYRIEDMMKVETTYTDDGVIYLDPLNLPTAVIMHGFSYPPPDPAIKPEGWYWGYPNGTFFQDRITKKITFTPYQSLTLQINL